MFLFWGDFWEDFVFFFLLFGVVVGDLGGEDIVLFLFLFFLMVGWCFGVIGGDGEFVGFELVVRWFFEDFGFFLVEFRKC